MLNSLTKPNLLKYALAGILALSIGIYFRLYPLLSFTPNDIHEKATLLVLSQVRSQIQNTIETAKPELTSDEKEKLIQAALGEVVHKEGKHLRSTIEEVSKKMTSAEGVEQKEPYLLASDGFYYYSLTQNILDTGKMAEKIKGSKYLNPLMLTPEGHWEPLTWHPYIGLFVYKIVKLFKPDASLMFGVSFTSLFVTALCLLVFVIICFSLRVSALQSFVASLYFLLIPIFVKRSTFAWYDNDPPSIFFPLVLLGLYFLALNRLENKKHLLMIAITSALTFMLYAFFWQGWVFLFSVFLGSGVAVLAFNFVVLKSKALNKNFLFFWISLLLSSFIVIGIAFGFSDFFILFQEGFIALSNFLTPQLSNWPDLYISVGELFKSSVGLLVELSGGPIIIVISLCGILFSLTDGQMRGDKPQTLKAVILLFYFAASLYLALGAQRFILLFVPPLSIGFALGLKKLYEFFIDTAQRFGTKFKGAKPLTANIISLIFILLTLAPIANIKNTLPSLLNPIYNETWDDALTHLKNNSPQESIINTWWTPGHFIKAIAQRRVTFDGATINVPQAYWMANVYLAPTEVEALGFLRMLNNSANQASEYLQKLKYPVSESVALIKEITSVERFKAKMILTAKLKNSEDVEAILKLTHSAPPPSYLLIFNELVEKNIQFGLFGKWNFKAIEAINRTPALLEKVPSRNSKEYIDFLWNLVGGPYKFSEPLEQIKRADKIAIFKHNLIVNTQTKDCKIDSPQYGRGIPYSIFYKENNQVVEKLQSGSNLSYSVLLLKDTDHYQAVLLDRALAQSMLIRLYYFDGAGLKYFKLDQAAADLTKRTVIKTFAIDWNQFQNDFGQ